MGKNNRGKNNRAKTKHKKAIHKKVMSGAAYHRRWTGLEQFKKEKEKKSKAKD